MKWGVETLTVPSHWSWEMRASLVGVASVLVLVCAWLFYLNLPVLVLPVLICGGVLVVFTLRHPIFGVLALVAAQYLPLGSGVGGLTVFQLIGGVVTALCLVYWAMTRRGFVFSWIVLPLIAFMFLTLHSLSFTHDVEFTHYLVRKLLLNVLFCLLLINIVDDFRKLRGLLWVMAGMGILNGLVGAVQFATGEALVRGVGNIFRSKGLQENENQLGELSALGLSVAVYAFLYGDRLWKQLLGLMACVMLSVGLVTSISRGATLALMAGMAWIALRESRQRKRLGVIAILALLAFPFLPKYFFDRFSNLNTDVRGTIALHQRVGLTTRGYFNKAGIKIWKAHPVLGVGMGNYGFYFIQPEFNPGVRGNRKLPPHNIYVQALAETGTVGFLVLCWWIVQMGFNYWQAERKTLADLANRGTLRACESMTVTAMVFYFSAGSLYYSNLALILTLSYLCRRCVENEKALSGVEAAGTTVPSRA
jgi:O-antigen ligase